MIDIKNLEQDAIDEIISNLISMGYSVSGEPNREPLKEDVLDMAVKDLGITDPQFSGDFTKGIYMIADTATLNYDGRRRRRRIRKESVEEYKRIVYGIVNVIKPYCTREWIMKTHLPYMEGKR